MTKLSLTETELSACVRARLPQQQNSECKMAFGLRESAVLALALSLATYFYLKRENEKNILSQVLHGLLEEERSVNITENLNVAVGFGSCMDLIVDGIPLVKQLGLQPPAAPRHHDVFSNKKQIAESFAYFLQEGAASEYV